MNDTESTENTHTRIIASITLELLFFSRSFLSLANSSLTALNPLFRLQIRSTDQPIFKLDRLAVLWLQLLSPFQPAE